MDEEKERMAKELEEAKAALSEELRFKAEARRNKRVGLWFASEVLGLSDDQQQTFATDTIFSTWSRFTCRYVLFSESLYRGSRLGKLSSIVMPTDLGVGVTNLPILFRRMDGLPSDPTSMALSLGGVASTPRSVLVRAGSRCVLPLL